MTAAALHRVQAHVLRPAHKDLTSSAFYFLTIDDPGRARELLRRLLAAGMTVSDADARSCATYPPDRAYVAVGFTREGLCLLGCCYTADENQVPRGATDPFADGMPARARLLNDPDTSRWDGTGRQMLLWVADTIDAPHRKDVDDLVEQSGLAKPYVEEGARTPGEPVILGFLDGTSQPFVTELATSPDRLPGGGTITPDGWRAVPLGEFVLGSTDAGEEHLVPEPVWLTLGGTFVVYRKYVVEVDEFEAFISSAASGPDEVAGPRDDAATVAAKVMGRYRAGESPPGAPAGYDAVIPAGTSPGTAPRGPNDFRYEQDTFGHACPLGAHIRRANPRDALGFEGRLTERHRIIRRGVPWRDGAEQGLLFVAVNARIQDQFEFIQRQWLNTGSALRLGGDIDLIAGSLAPDEGAGEAEVRFVIQGTEPVVLRAQRPFARLVGGDYYLMPGMAGLRELARVGQ